MPNLTGKQIRDGSVQRDDLDISTVGQSVVRKIIQGSGVIISSTGADSGTGDVTINATGGSASLLSAILDFSDGDTFKRFSISDAGVLSTSKINGTIRRPDVVDDSQDRGYIFIHNIVRIYNGGFDLLVACTGWGMDDPVELPPLGTVEFHYIKG